MALAMNVDPTPLLATVAGTSATLVAIVGGLLVARYVTIDSEQEGAQHLLDDAEQRQTIATKRAEDATIAVKNFEIYQFLERKVIDAIGEGTIDIATLRDISGYGTILEDDELAGVVAEISNEYRIAHETLSDILADHSLEDSDKSWSEFQANTHGLPSTRWDEVWETTYRNIIHPPQVRIRSLSGGYVPGAMIIPTPPEYVTDRRRRRDDLRSTQDRARQQLEDLSQEVIRLRRQRDAIVRPKGLAMALTIISYFAIVGVIVPIWLMSRGPTNLTHAMGTAVFWLFTSGLALLLAYMAQLALRLSSARKSSAADRTDHLNEKHLNPEHRLVDLMGGPDPTPGA